MAANTGFLNCRQLSPISAHAVKRDGIK